MTAAAKKFCPKCGALWNPLWTECNFCAARARQATAAKVGTHIKRGASIVSPMALYFTLLVASALAIACIRFAHLDSSRVVAAVAILDALIVIAWCAADRANVVPALRTIPGPKWFGIAMAIACVTFVVATICVAIVRHVFNTRAAADPYLTQSKGWLIAILLFAVQPAIIEELAFRGVVLSGLRRILEPNEAIQVSAGLFMILHLAIFSFPHLFLIGVAVGYLRVKTGSLYPGMLLHFTHNLLCLIPEHYLR